VNDLQQELKDALSVIYTDPNDYIYDRGFLEQLTLDYFYEKYKNGPNQAEKHSKMYEALRALSSRQKCTLHMFIEAINLDQDFPLWIEYRGCCCEFCEHITILEVDVEWKAGVVPINTLE
jgi:hypothetical protein